MVGACRRGDIGDPIAWVGLDMLRVLCLEISTNFLTWLERDFLKAWLLEDKVNRWTLL